MEALGFAVAATRAKKETDTVIEAEEAIDAEIIAEVEEVEMVPVPLAEENIAEAELLPISDDSEALEQEALEVGEGADTGAELQNLADVEQAAAPVEEDEDIIDEEILEIFIEEAEEVTETINEFFPQWAQDFNNEEALVEFRRAFHTLKGSGRMVEAHDIGELAWVVESMLNRVIDGTVLPNQAYVTLIERVRLLLPTLIEAFRDKFKAMISGGALFSSVFRLIIKGASYTQTKNIEAEISKLEYVVQMLLKSVEPDMAEFEVLTPLSLSEFSNRISQKGFSGFRLKVIDRVDSDSVIVRYLN